MRHDQRRSAGDLPVPTRRALIAATQRLLAAGGVAALTSRAIADEARANLASITYYFGSKENLVTESMVASARELLAPVASTLRSDSEPTTKLLQSVTLLNRILDEHRNALGAYVQALAASPTNPSIAAALQTLHRDMSALLAEQIADQRSAGQLPVWVEPAAMAELIVAVVHGTLLAAVIDPRHTDEAAIASQFTQLLLGLRHGV
ncbi:MAG: TetR/AcrR family transcriptional regulator [Ilumatobacteraceae bacterium]